MFISTDLTNIYVLESISNLDIFQFDLMFVKPHNVPPLLCFNVQTEMRFGVEQLLFPEGMRCKKELFYSKSHFSFYGIWPFVTYFSMLSSIQIFEFWGKYCCMGGLQMDLNQKWPQINMMSR